MTQPRQTAADPAHPGPTGPGAGHPGPADFGPAGVRTAHPLPDRPPAPRRQLRRFRRGAGGAHVEQLRQAHARRSGDALRADQRTDLECVVECRGARRASRTLSRAARSMERHVNRGTGAALASLRDDRAAAELEARPVVVDGRAVPLAEARRIAAAPPQPGARHLDRDGHLVRLLGHLLLLVDTAALVVVFGFLLNLDWAAPQPADLVTVVALAVFGAAVQALLAVRLGRRLWAWRHADPDADPGEEFPPRAGVVLLAAGLLTVLAALAAVALYVRVTVEATLADAGPLGVTLGALLAAAALAAPWCVVAQEAYRHSPEQRERRAATAAVERVERRRGRLRARSGRRLDRAEQARTRAESLFQTARRRCVAHHLDDHEVILWARGLVDPAVVHELGTRGAPGGFALPPAVAADLAGLTAALDRLDTVLDQARRAPGRRILDLAA
ncbi:hypothetical protein GCM10009836_15480 [Pseudonocardia ailaonensis]|uniref:Integral membrane protein n=1 Tax=Pseudonocardia ailaonensis TaxID=367279 RepID=A0ABN2MTX6_9PSEU